MIFAFKHGSAPHVNTFELGQHGRYHTNVWQYKGVNTLRAGRMAELALHPTVKPVQMTAAGYRKLLAFVQAGFTRDADGEPTPVNRGLYGRSYFFKGLDNDLVDALSAIARLTRVKTPSVTT